MSLLLANKYVLHSHFHLGVFSRFCIISFNKLVNSTWDDERAFNKKFVTSRQFPFLRYLSQCCFQFKYGYVFPFLFLYFLISFLHIPYLACRHIVRFFLSPYPFPELFYTVLSWCFFYHDLIFPYFSR